MEVKPILNLENPFLKSGRLWLILSILTILGGLLTFISIKPDLQLVKSTIQEELALPLAFLIVKALIGSLLLGTGIKYLIVSLSSLFKFDPDKRLTEDLTQTYKPRHLFEIFQSKNLELFKPHTLVENLTVRIFRGLKNLPTRYFIVSQNFINALLSIISPIILLIIAIFLDYLEIITLYGNNKIEWLTLLLSLLVVLSWSPFSPMTGLKKLNKKGIVSVAFVIGSLLIIRTGNFDYTLPTIPSSIYVTCIVLFVLSIAYFSLFFYLLKRRITIENINDNITAFKEDFDLDVRPEEIYRVFSNRLIDLGDSNLINRVYHDNFDQKEGNFRVELMHETQPNSKETIKDSIISKLSNQFTVVGSVFSVFGLIALIISIQVAVEFLQLLSFSILFVGIFSFGLKIMNLCSLFLSEYLFSSKLVTVIISGEFKSAQLTAGKGIHDNLESRNEVIRSSLSMQIAASNISSVSFLQLGKSDPLENSPRYVVSMNKDDESVAYLAKSLSKHASQKTQIAGISNQTDLDTAKKLRSDSKPENLPDSQIDKLLGE